MRFQVLVAGDYACFARPEFKVERVSYLMMTPSAARGVLDAIFWKPEFGWEVRSITVLNPIRQTSIMRNELDQAQGTVPLIIERHRQLRSSLILKDVAYVIDAEIVLRSHATDPIRKYSEQFERRLARGQCHHTPYLGTREFAASFEPATGTESPLSFDMQLGTMLFDIAFITHRQQREMSFATHASGDRASVGGYAQPLFFQADLRQGTLVVPREKYAELHELERSDAESTR